ncbi:MAG TPA: homoserine kinase [Solirubrobacteraceae bacterium]|nr:homoserine kinase [Solirubrobacteraceae bacterium]
MSAAGSGEAGGGQADAARRPAGASGYSRRRVVRVPASSANLGPGFDSMAAALGLHLELEVRETGQFAVRTDLAVARGRTNLCVQAFERLHPADSFTFTITSQIPLAGGFGSSAAATVAGLMAADHLFELDADLLTLASELEGHPDNAAAALNGGFVICADGQATRFDPPTGLEAIAVVPEDAVATRVAREALPAEVPLGEAVFNIAHGALLTLGLAKGDWDLVARGLRDDLHQRRRAPLFPRSYRLALRARELGALGATISGAGPTVLVWCFYEQTGAVADALGGEVEGWARLVRTPFEAQGAYVEDL